MPRTGRPRGFDRDEAVQQALRLFWAQGYEATSLAQLKAAMGGVSAASFYAAFGSKEALFQDVLGQYLETHGQVLAPLDDPALPPRAAIEQALRQSAGMQADHAHGCLVILSATTCSSCSQGVHALLAERRERNRAGLRACVQRAIDAGELPDSVDAAGLAVTFDTFLAGLSVQARDKVPLASLNAAISGLMQVWDALAASGRRH